MKQLLPLVPLLLLCSCAQERGNQPVRLRVATFNASLNRAEAGQLRAVLSDPTAAGKAFQSEQVRAVAETIQRVRPDVLLINEFDYEEKAPALVDLFHDNYLATGQSGAEPIRFPYRFAPPVNTGVSSGLDLDGKNGTVTQPGQPGYAEDCFGFGQFPGQYGFAVYSRFPIETGAIKTFQKFPWKDLPGNLLMEKGFGLAGPDGGYYGPGVAEKLRLSSKTHADIPINVGGRTFHLLASHPTPPAFDGPEDRNGRRNHDEIKFWTLYLDGSAALEDDAGRRGGLARNQPFVILGDLNCDPVDGESRRDALLDLLGHSGVNSSFTSESEGAEAAALHDKGRNLSQKGPARQDTADFGDGGSAPGNLRVDHVIPSKAGFKVLGGGVFWPVPSDPVAARLAHGQKPSDHRLVWLDLELAP